MTVVRDNRWNYPLTCVFLGHRWIKRIGQQGAYRNGQCRRCAHIDAPEWMVRYEPGVEWHPSVLKAFVKGRTATRLSALDGIRRAGEDQ